MSTDALRGNARSPASPEARLEASRQAMRAAMLPRPADPAGRPPAAVSSLPGPLDRLLSHPVLAVLRDGVRRWWHKRPWRPVVVIGAEVASKAMVPLARRHPGRLIGGAMLAGALLSRLKPWKWIAKSIAPALLASLVPVIVSRLSDRIQLSTLLQAVGLGPAPAPAPAPARAAVPAPVPPAPMPPAPGSSRAPATVAAVAPVTRADTRD